MTLRRLQAAPIENPPALEQLPNPEGTIPAIWIDDVSGVMYIGGVAVQGGASGAIQISGPGAGNVAGSPTLADFNVTDGDEDWITTWRSVSATSGEVLALQQSNNGDFFFGTYQADGTLINQFIFRGVSNGGAIRFGPDTTHGFAITPGGLAAIDGNVQINATSGEGAGFPSVGGGNVQLKPANFSDAARVQLLPNADGTVGVIVPAPLLATSVGVPGMVAFDATHIYICTAANTWIRSTAATW